MILEYFWLIFDLNSDSPILLAETARHRLRIPFRLLTLPKCETLRGRGYLTIIE
jgi:hypothetical protein